MLLPYLIPWSLALWIITKVRIVSYFFIGENFLVSHFFCFYCLARDESLFTHTKQSSDSSSSYPSPPTEVKAKRKRANPYQLDRLQRAYDLNPFPSNEERQYLANELGMSPNSVRIWYQNKRQALRNFEKAQSQSP